MEDGLFSMLRVHGPTSMVRLLKEIVLKALGPSLGVKQMWTKKNDHAPKSECADFFKYMLKIGNSEKNSSSTILLSFLGLRLSSLLGQYVVDGACKSSHNNFCKNK